MNGVIERLAAVLGDRYRIDREVGAGGMATVYLAHDVKHARDVAIKVLRPELGAVLGVERFLAEIRVTANLQHPNLLPLFDSGEVDGLLYYVMPFVEGETLRARLERENQLPVEEALRLAVAIAQALDYAHRRGVIHRDLKPENILLADGQPLVADFGIALAVSKAGGQRVTQTGLSLGTPQYMSPEQATGDRAVDARTDVYSLGAMTYEMLTGEAPHTGTTAQAIIARLMTEEVRPLSVVRRSVPAHVDAAVRHALEKLAADRFATAGDFALALQGKGDAATLARYLTHTANVQALPATRRRAWREIVAWGVAGVAVSALAWVELHPPALAESPVVRTTIDTPARERVMIGGFPIVLTPQGDRMAYVTQSAKGYRTVVRRTSELGEGVTLAAQTLRHMVFSPDGRWIAYVDSNQVRRIPSDGGASQTIGNSGSRTIMGLAWTAEEIILIGTTSGLLTMPARGGTALLATDSASAGLSQYPVLMPDGKTVIVGGDSSRLVAISLDTRKTTNLGVSGDRAFGLIDGHLVYLTGDAELTFVQMDLGTLRVTGDPVPIERGVEGVALSASGTLAYMPGASDVKLVLASGGAEEAARSEAGQYADPRFSPDGRRIAVTVTSKEGEDIWIYDRTADTFTRLTRSGKNTVPEWTPDGRRVLFKSENRGKTTIAWMPVDGSGSAETLLDAGWDINEAIISPDGRWLVVRTPPGEARPRDILAIDLTGDRKTFIPIATGPASQQMPRLSPDGRWLAYQSDESGRMEIYVRPFPNEGARVQVSSDGGTEPLWDGAGRTLFYRAGDGITASTVTTGATFSFGARRLVLPGNESGAPTHPSYDVSADGQRFLVLRPVGGEAKAIIVHNWIREFRETLAGARR